MTVRGGRRRLSIAGTRAHHVSSLPWSEELDGEADRTVRLDEVLDVRRDALRLTRLHDDVGQGCRLGDEAQTALIDSQTTPGSTRHPTSASAERPRGQSEPRGDRTADMPWPNQHVLANRRR